MGRNLTQITLLPDPLRRVTERVMFLPPGARLGVDNIERKIVLLLDGRVSARVNDLPPWPMQPGDLLSVPGPCRQTYDAPGARRETRMHALVISLAPTAIGTAADFWERHFGQFQMHRAVLSPAAQTCLELFRTEARGSGEVRGLRVAAHLWLLLTEIARRLPDAAAAPSVAAATSEPLSRSEWIVARVRDYLSEHLAQPLTLDTIAWHLRMSAEHVARTFRATTGTTIFAELESLRLARARTLLAGSQLGLADVAAQSGFGTTTQLCRVFRRVQAETPLHYRLRVQREATSSPSEFETVWP